MNSKQWPDLTKTTFAVSVTCGTETCARAPSEFCEYVGSVKFGTVHVCLLFPAESPSHKQCGSYTVLEENEHGWLKRCDACIKAEKAFLEIQKKEK